MVWCCYICLKSDDIINLKLITDIDVHNISWTTKLSIFISEFMFPSTCKLCIFCCNEVDNVIKFRTKCINSIERNRECIKGSDTEKDEESLRKYSYLGISSESSESETPLSEMNKKTELSLDKLLQKQDQVESISDSNKELTQREKKEYSYKSIDTKTINRYSCENCSKMFECDETFKLHKEECLIRSVLPDTERRKGKCIITSNKKRPEGIQPVNGQFPCNLCEKIFKWRHTLSRHKDSVHVLGKEFPCPECSLYFASDRYLREHVQKQHRDSRKKEGPRPGIVCPICGKRVKKLSNHRSIHENMRSFKCDQCPKGFNTAGNLRTHIQQVHVNPETWPHICTICQRTFAFSGALKTHLLKHSTEKKFTCHLCNRQFKQQVSLRLHLDSHSDERRFKCEQCDADFNRVQNLRIHEARKHGRLGIKIPVQSANFMCYLCPKTFPTNAKCSIHIRMHTGDKPFQCDLCDKRFVDKAYVKKHMKNVHNMIEDNSKYISS